MNLNSQFGECYDRSYKEVRRDEVKYLFDILANNEITNIAKETGYTLNFIHKTVEEYTK